MKAFIFAALLLSSAFAQAENFSLQCIQTLPNGGAYSSVTANVVVQSEDKGLANIVVIQGGSTILNLRNYPVQLNRWSKGTEIFDQDISNDELGLVKIGVSSLGTIGDIFVKEPTEGKIIFGGTENDCYFND